MPTGEHHPPGRIHRHRSYIDVFVVAIEQIVDLLRRRPGIGRSQVKVFDAPVLPEIEPFFRDEILSIVPVYRIEVRKGEQDIVIDPGKRMGSRYIAGLQDNLRNVQLLTIMGVKTNCTSEKSKKRGHNSTERRF